MLSNKKEQEIFEKGYNLVACCDEVGRGCILGSVVAAAVIMPKNSFIEGVNDSKKLSPKKREILYNEIVKQALAIGIGEIDHVTIDKINIKKASQLAMKMAIENLQTQDGKKICPDYILVDAETIPIDIPQEAIIHGDSLCYGIAAASIVAKVYRDRLCIDWHNMYPHFEIQKHKGYATKDHIKHLVKNGPTNLHRKTFIKKILQREQKEQLELFQII